MQQKTDVATTSRVYWELSVAGTEKKTCLKLNFFSRHKYKHGILADTEVVYNSGGILSAR